VKRVAVEIVEPGREYRGRAGEYRAVQGDDGKPQALMAMPLGATRLMVKVSPLRFYKNLALI